MGDFRADLVVREALSKDHGGEGSGGGDVFRKRK